MKKFFILSTNDFGEGEFLNNSGYDETNSDIDNNQINKVFVLFILIHVIVWSALCLVRHLLPVDALEGIVWGSYLDFGTHKHPPLAGWLSYFVYNWGNIDFSLYFMGQVCVALGFVYIYKLGSLFLSRQAAIYSVMVLEGCFSYSYMSIFDGFNPNFLIFITFPAITYYFYLAITKNKLKDWILLGTFIGFSMLAKYQTVLLLSSLVLFLLIYRKFLKHFLNYKLYLAIIISALINIPHLLWLIKNNFFSWVYFIRDSNANIISHFTTIAIFFSQQLAAVCGTLLIFGILYRKFSDKKSNKQNLNKQDSVYILFSGLLPLILQAAPHLFTGERLIGTWGYPMLFCTGVILFYFFPVKINKKSFDLLKKCVYSVMGIIFLILLILFSVEKNFRSTYPYEVISQDLKAIYKSSTGKDLKYVAGYMEFALPISVYDKSHPKIIFETYGHKNPWINENDLKKSGAMIISRSSNASYEHLIHGSEKYLEVPYSEYEFTIKNKFNKKRTYNIYYKIIKPQI